MPNPATGTVVQCWRYPVKSLQGFAVEGFTVTGAGVRGDRARALVDPGTDRLLSAKRTSALLTAFADDDGVTLPDGESFGFEDSELDEVLSGWLGRQVHLAGPAETGPLSYEMTFDPPDDDAEYYEIPAPPDSFLDLAPVHLVTTATLEGCRKARPDLDWDVRRFRPNLVVDVEGPPFVEDSWAGRRLAVGDAVLAIDGPTVRCAMPLRAQPGGLARQPELFDALTELNVDHPNHLGLYAQVVTPGEVAVGDRVALA